MKAVRILILEDDEDQAFMLAKLLEVIAGETFTVTRAGSLKEAKAALRQGTFDIALTDLNVGDERGIETFRGIHVEAPDLPVVILSATDDDKLALEAVKEGAQEFLVKPCNERTIINTILRSIERQAHRLTGPAHDAARIAVELLTEIVDRFERVVSAEAATDNLEG